VFDLIKYTMGLNNDIITTVYNFLEPNDKLNLYQCLNQKKPTQYEVAFQKLKTKNLQELCLDIDNVTRNHDSVCDDFKIFVEEYAKSLNVNSST
jgi:aspartate ammonia-lyase